MRTLPGIIDATPVRPLLGLVSPAISAAVAARDHPAGRLSFYSEDILIDVRGDVVEVTGTYHFRISGGPVPAQPMLYPYPRDRLLGAAWTLRLARRQPDGRWMPLSSGSSSRAGCAGNCRRRPWTP